MRSGPVFHAAMERALKPVAGAAAELRDEYQANPQQRMPIETDGSHRSRPTSRDCGESGCVDGSPVARRLYRRRG